MIKIVNYLCGLIDVEQVVEQNPLFVHVLNESELNVWSYDIAPFSGSDGCGTDWPRFNVRQPQISTTITTVTSKIAKWTQRPTSLTWPAGAMRQKSRNY